MIGKTQPAPFHPEGDAWRHSLLALEAAALVTKDPEVRFAALVHDLGKGATPQERLPHHYGHEERGVKIVEGLCKRLRVPNRFQKLAVMASSQHMRCHRVAEMRPQKVVKLLRQVDAFRNQARFEQLLQVCAADVNGRGKNPVYYHPADELRASLETCLAIDHRKLARSGATGARFGEALHVERIRRIKAWRAAHKDAC